MKKLSLTLETLRQLDENQAQAVAGGQINTFYPCTAKGCVILISNACAVTAN